MLLPVPLDVLLDVPPLRVPDPVLQLHEGHEPVAVAVDLVRDYSGTIPTPIDGQLLKNRTETGPA